jgi:hypothetical protein
MNRFMRAKKAKQTQKREQKTAVFGIFNALRDSSRVSRRARRKAWIQLTADRFSRKPVWQPPA